MATVKMWAMATATRVADDKGIRERGGDTTTAAAEGSLMKRPGGTPRCCLVRTTDDLATMGAGEESRT